MTDKQDKALHIISLTAEHFKRLTAVHIEPDTTAGVIRITGANEAGKTSVLDAIAAALGGKKLVPVEPIHSGAEAATLTVNIGDLTIKRRITAGGTDRLEVTNAEGASFKKPQDILNNLIGALSFNPSSFLDAKGADQAAMLMKTIVLPVDWEAFGAATDKAPPDTSKVTDPLAYMDAIKKEFYEKRTTANVRARDLLGQIKSEAALIPEGMETVERVEIADILKDRAGAEAVIAAKDTQEDVVKGLGEDMSSTQSEIAALKFTINAAQERYIGLDKLHKAEHDKLVKMRHSLPDLSEFDKRITDAETINRAADTRKRVSDITAQRVAAEDAANLLTATMAEIDRIKLAALTACEMPVPGLTIEDGALRINGTLLDQCSHAQRLKLAISIGMALNPKLRVLLVKDGEKFDTASWAVVTESATQNDFQIWVEQMDESGEVGVYIEAGEIKAVDGKEVE